MSGVRSPLKLSLVCASSLLLSSRLKDSRGESPDPPHQQRSRGQAEISPLTLPVFHSFTCTHTHWCTDTAIQCPRCQPLASSRCLRTGGTSVLDSPSSPPPLATFVGERLAVKSEPTACLSARTSTPPRHKIPLIRMHLLWHHDLPLFSACNSRYLWRIFFPPPNINSHPSLGFSLYEHHTEEMSSSLCVPLLHLIILLLCSVVLYVAAVPWQQHLSLHP